MRIRKSLFGYRRASVKEAIQSLEQAHAERISELLARKERLLEEHRQLTEELERLRASAAQRSGKQEEGRGEPG